MMNYTQAIDANDSINGAYFGPAVEASAMSTPADVDGGGALSVPGGQRVTHVVLWWFILLGVCVASHVITLRMQE